MGQHKSSLHHPVRSRFPMNHGQGHRRGRANAPTGTERGKVAYMVVKNREKAVKNRIGYLFQRIGLFSGAVLSDIATNYALLIVLAFDGPTHAYELRKRILKDHLVNFELEIQPDYRMIERHILRLVKSRQQSHHQRLGHLPSRANPRCIKLCDRPI
jgi:hypothetical protein